MDTLTESLPTDQQEPAGAREGETAPLSLILDMARHLGCAEAVPDEDGHCRLLLNDAMSLALWPHPDQSRVVLVADVPWPDGENLQVVHRAALGFNLGSASRGAPALAVNEDGRLVLAWTLPMQGSPRYAEEGISCFLEHLALAESAVARPVAEQGGDASAPEALTALPDDLAAGPQAVIEKAIASCLNLDGIEYDDDGCCFLQRESGCLLLVQRAPDRGATALFAQVGSLQEPAENICAGALEFNYPAAVDNAPVLGLDVENGGLFLIASFASSEAVAADMDSALERFFCCYGNCRGEVFSLEQFEGLAESGGEEEEPEREAELPAGSVRV